MKTNHAEQQRAPGLGSSGDIKLCSYNIHAGVGMDGRFDADRLGRVLREVDADVLGLQEVEHHAVGQGDLLDYLAAETGTTAVAGSTLLRDTRHYGNALLTRLPILDIHRIDLTMPRREPRGALDVLLDWHGRELRVVATHLGLRPSERREQTRRLLSLFETSREDVAVLMGDLNEWLLWGRPLRWLRKHFAATPDLRTFPACLPLLALDQVWVKPRCRLAQLKTHRTPLSRAASDHLPLTAVLAPAPETKLDNPLFG